MFGLTWQWKLDRETMRWKEALERISALESGMSHNNLRLHAIERGENVSVAGLCGNCGGEITVGSAGSPTAKCSACASTYTRPRLKMDERRGKKKAKPVARSIRPVSVQADIIAYHLAMADHYQRDLSYLNCPFWWLR